MSSIKHLLGSIFVLAVVSHGADDVESKESEEAVVKALVDAEMKHEPEADKDASAVAEATMAALKSDSAVEKGVSQEVLKDAEDAATKTFKDLDEANVDVKVAADAAAKVAVAEIDGASDIPVPKNVEENAEKVAVAVGEALSEDPDNPVKAMGDSMAIVEKELETPGEVDLSAAKEGIVGMAEGSVEEVVEESSQVSGGHPMFIIVVPFVLMALYAGRGYYKEYTYESVYMKTLRQHREQEGCVVENSDLEMYKGFHA